MNLTPAGGPKNASLVPWELVTISSLVGSDKQISPYIWCSYVRTSSKFLTEASKSVAGRKEETTFSTTERVRKSFALHGGERTSPLEIL